MPLLRCIGTLPQVLPSKRPSPIVNLRLLSGGISAEKSSPSTLLPVRLRWAAYNVTCDALIDSGAEGNFMDTIFARQHGLPTSSLTHLITVNALNGQRLPNISQTTDFITLITSGNHNERIQFMLMDSTHAPVVLGHPWLTKHNPRIDWQLNTINEWSTLCHRSCLLSACPTVSASVLQEKAADLSNVPKEYLDLREVFSKSRAASLPPHVPMTLP